MKNLVASGKVSKSVGFKGELVVLIKNLSPEVACEQGVLFLDRSGQLIPYIVERISHRSRDAFTVKFENIENDSEAKSLIGSPVMINSEILQEAESLPGEEIIGFSVVDEVHGPLGIVNQFIDIQSNPLFEVSGDDWSGFIPVTEEIVIGVDWDNKVIQVNCPEGLIDLNS